MFLSVLLKRNVRTDGKQQQHQQQQQQQQLEIKREKSISLR